MEFTGTEKIKVYVWGKCPEQFEKPSSEGTFHVWVLSAVAEGFSPISVLKLIL